MYLCIYVFKVWWLTLAAVLCVSSHLSEGFQASRHVNRTHISKTSRMLHPTVTTSLPWQLLALLAHQFTCTNLHMNPRIYSGRVWTAVTMYPVIFDQLFAERHQPGNWFLHPVAKHLGELGIRSQAGFPLSPPSPHVPSPRGPLLPREPLSWRTGLSFHPDQASCDRNERPQNRRNALFILHRKCSLTQQLYKLRAWNFQEETGVKLFALQEANTSHSTCILVPSTLWKYTKKESSFAHPLPAPVWVKVHSQGWWEQSPGKGWPRQPAVPARQLRSPGSSLRWIPGAFTSSAVRSSCRITEIREEDKKE